MPELSEAVVRRLRGGAWPGNVRELQNCMERCLALCGEVVEVEHLPPELSGVEGGEEGEEERGEGWPTLFEVERRHILRVVEAVSGNKSRAARVLGIDRKTLHARLARYGRA